MKLIDVAAVHMIIWGWSRGANHKINERTKLSKEGIPLKEAFSQLTLYYFRVIYYLTLISLKNASHLTNSEFVNGIIMTDV